MAEALLAGHVVRVADTSIRIENITGRLSTQSNIRGQRRVNVRTTPQGIVVWLTPKGDQ